jgi:hypothetical protein
MKAQCAQAAMKAAGRQLSDAELRAIDDSIGNFMRHPPQKLLDTWQSLPMGERMVEAAKAATDSLLANKAKDAQREALKITAAARNDARIAAIAPKVKNAAMAVGRRLEEVDVYGKGVRNEYFGRMLDTIEAAAPKWFGLVEDAAAARDFVREVFEPGSTKNQVAEHAAKAWLGTIEAMRVRFNKAGGDVGKLDYGYLPQMHDVERVLQSGRDAWVDHVLPLVDRRRYLNADGSGMNDQAVRDMLGKAWETISSDGTNKIEPGKNTGSGMRANRGSESRVIHFKDADAYLNYMNDFGRTSIFGGMQKHVAGMARDIALIEEMGPNPEQEFRRLNDTAIKSDGGRKLFGPLAFRVDPEIMWKSLSGFTSQQVHPTYAKIWQGARNWTTAAKLQGALLSSLSDIPTLAVTARLNHMPELATLGESIRAIGSDYKDHAGRLGLVADSISSEMNRWAEGNIGQGWTNKLAQMTMKLSLLEGWTDALRTGFGVSMMDTYGKLIGKDWGALSREDRFLLERKGFSAGDWANLQKATPEDWNGRQLLTPDAVRNSGVPDAQRLASRLLGHIIDEGEYAVIGPDLMTKSGLEQGTQRGTPSGEFRRSLFLFKSFTVAMINRHLRRSMELGRELGKGSAAAYGAQLMVGLSLFGMLSLQAKDLASGKDPRDMSNPKAWRDAFAQGGGLGIYSDILYTGMGGQNRGGAPNWSSLAGPVFGTAFDLADVTLGNLAQEMRGKDSKFGAELLRFGRQNMPAVNLWYAKAALDHMFFHNAQEHLSPGYLSRMRQTARKDWGQDYWWNPGEGLPSRAPNLAASIGQ